ncbi:DUF2384 domain-containing protein [Pseudomonas moorei]|nr:DUF2384 domain-containing protein [Pseudomonas moorei]
MSSQTDIKNHDPIHTPPTDIWTLLGLSSGGYELYELLHNGLPYAYYERLSVILKGAGDELRRCLGISSATLSKRRKAGRLSLAEGDRLWSVAAVLNDAFVLFGNDLDSAIKWMGTPSRALNLKTPLEMLDTRVEMNAVRDLIGRLEEGVLV